MSSRILLITPEFYGVEKTINSLLENFGNDVVWLENKNLQFDFKGKKSKFKFFRKIYFFLFSPRERYIDRKLKNIDNLCFDILFSINCNIVCPHLINRLKAINPRLFSILYLWDSFSMYSWEKEIRLFSKVYSFDRLDSERYEIEYLPNFFIASKVIQKADVEYDLSFVGKFSPERMSVIDKLMLQVSKTDLKYLFFLWPAYKILLHNTLIYKFLKIFHIKTRLAKSYLLHFEANEMLLERDFIYRQKLSFEDSQKLLQSSNVILDLPIEEQTGYSHRLIAALANGKKVITTNQNIRSEVFYNPNQIQFVDYKNPVINIKWIREKSEFKIDPYFSQLELSKWLNFTLNARIA